MCACVCVRIVKFIERRFLINKIQFRYLSMSGIFYMQILNAKVSCNNNTINKTAEAISTSACSTNSNNSIIVITLLIFRISNSSIKQSFIVAVVAKTCNQGRLKYDLTAQTIENSILHALMHTNVCILCIFPANICHQTSVESSSAFC